MAVGRRRRVIIQAPPRHGKSVLISQWLPAWWLCHYPDHEVAIASSGAELAEEHGGYARDIAAEFGPRYFGRTVRHGAKAGVNGWQLEGYRGKVHAIGKGGSFTGKGADFLIVDDPIKDAAEAYSSTARENLWRWWTTVAYKRLNQGARALLMFTRWHEDDLIGRILDVQPGRWDVLNIPGIAEADDPLGRAPGDALWPVNIMGQPAYPVAYLEELRAIDPYSFAAQVQGRPAPAEGALYHRAHFRYARDRTTHFDLIQPDGSVRRALKSECLWFGVADFAHRQNSWNDYTVLLICALTPARDLIIADVSRDKIGLAEQWPWVQQRKAAWPWLAEGGYIVAEFRHGGHAAFGMAEAAGQPFVKVVIDADKVSRAMTSATMYGAGKVYHMQDAPWLDAFERELLVFPTGKHDDQVDCVAQAAIQAQGERAQAYMLDRRPDGSTQRSWSERDPDLPDPAQVDAESPEPSPVGHGGYAVVDASRLGMDAQPRKNGIFGGYRGGSIWRR